MSWRIEGASTDKCTKPSGRAGGASGCVTQAVSNVVASNALAMRISVGFQNGLHFSDVAFTARLFDEEVKDFGMEA